MNESYVSIRRLCIAFFSPGLLLLATATAQAGQEEVRPPSPGKARMNVVFLDDAAEGLPAGVTVRRNHWPEWDARIPTFQKLLRTYIADFQKANGPRPAAEASLYALEISADMEAAERDRQIAEYLAAIADATMRSTLVLARSTAGTDQLRLVYVFETDCPPKTAAGFLAALSEITPPVFHGRIGERFGPFCAPPTVVFDPRANAFAPVPDDQKARHRWALLEEDAYLLPHYVLHAVAMTHESPLTEEAVWFADRTVEPGTSQTLVVDIPGVRTQGLDRPESWAPHLISGESYTRFNIRHEGSLGSLQNPEPGHTITIPANAPQHEIRARLQPVFNALENNENVYAKVDKNLWYTSYAITGKPHELQWARNVGDEITRFGRQNNSEMTAYLNAHSAGTITAEKMDLQMYDGVILSSYRRDAADMSRLATQYPSTPLLWLTGDRDFPHGWGGGAMRVDEPNVTSINLKTSALLPTTVHSQVATGSTTGIFEIKDSNGLRRVDGTLGDLVADSLHVNNPTSSALDDRIDRILTHEPAFREISLRPANQDVMSAYLLSHARRETFGGSGTGQDDLKMGGILFEGDNRYLVNLSGRIAKEASAEVDRGHVARGFAMGKLRYFDDLPLLWLDLADRRVGSLPVSVPRFLTAADDDHEQTFGGPWSFEPITLEVRRNPAGELLRATITTAETRTRVSYSLLSSLIEGMPPILTIRNSTGFEPLLKEEEDGRFVWTLRHGVKIEFDSDGLVEAIRSPHGEHIAYRRQSGQLVGQQASDGRRIEIRYGAARPEIVTLDGQPRVTYNYGTDSRLDRVSGNREDLSIGYNASERPSLIKSDAYTLSLEHDEQSRLTAVASGEVNVRIEYLEGTNTLRFLHPQGDATEWLLGPISGPVMKDRAVLLTRSMAGRILQVSKGPVQEENGLKQFTPSELIMLVR